MKSLRRIRNLELLKVEFESTEINLQEEAENARNIVRAEGATRRLRALEIERQYGYDINEQKLRDESIARNMQQRLIELEHQCDS